MDNSKAIKPMGTTSPWEIAEKRVRRLNSEQASAAIERRRDLTFATVIRKVNGDPLDTQEIIDWDINMPIPLGLCARVVEKAQYLSKEDIIALYFSHYTMEDDESVLIDKLVSIGRAIAKEGIMKVVLTAAKEGCVKSQAMMLDQFDKGRDGGGGDIPSVNITLNGTGGVEIDDGKGGVEIIEYDETGHDFEGNKVVEFVQDPSADGGRKVVPIR